MLPLIGELVLDGLESGEAGNIVMGAETVATEFKNEILKGGIFGLSKVWRLAQVKNFMKKLKKILVIVITKLRRGVIRNAVIYN